MVIIKMLQKKVDMEDISIDKFIHTLRNFDFDYIRGAGFKPLFERNQLTDRLQEVNGIVVDTQIVETKKMNRLYRNVKVG